MYSRSSHGSSHIIPLKSCLFAVQNHLFRKCSHPFPIRFPTIFPPFSKVFHFSQVLQPFSHHFRKCSQVFPIVPTASPKVPKAQATEAQPQPGDEPGDGPGEARQEVEGRRAGTRGRHHHVHLGGGGGCCGWHGGWEIGSSRWVGT